ncbi:MAG: HD family hydrolase [Chloroflexota bacterium]
MHGVDIAHALSSICRFGGHCRTLYTVAQHSLLVSALCPPEYALCGLLHDATEAYGMLDIPAPLKHQPVMAGYRYAEHRLGQVIAERFALPWPIPEAVHVADRQVVAAELRDLMSCAGMRPTGPGMAQRIIPMQPDRAEGEFLARLAELVP